MPSLELFHNYKFEEIKNISMKENERRKSSRADVVSCENYFQKLPDEILMEIFEKLHWREQQNLTKVCQRFKNLLVTSTSFIRSSKLKIESETRLTTAFILPFSRVLIRQAWKSHIKKRALRIFQNYRNTINELSIDRGETMFNLKIVKLVNESLTDLRLNYAEKKLDIPHDKIKINFPNLKKLNVNYAGLMLRHIGEHKIEEMFIRDDEEKLREFNEFLATCGRLKKLTLDSFIPSFDQDVHTYKLEELECILSEPQSEVRIKKFLRPHKETLKKLKCKDGGWEATKYAITKMNVEELWCDKIELQSEETLKINKSIKKLRVFMADYEGHPPVENVYKVIEACKNVEDFTLVTHVSCQVSRKCLKIIQDNMKNLKHLSLKRITTFVHSLTFENLETLKIDKLFSKDEHKCWISLASCSPNIKKVYIHQFRHSYYTSKEDFITIQSDDIRNLLNTCKNLQELHIGPQFDISDEFVEAVLSSESKSFWYLRIKTFRFGDDSERAKIFEGTKIRCEIVRCYDDEEDDDDILMI